MRAIVSGMIATYPVGGVVWDYAQYALGLERLGFEVYYLEDTGTATYDPLRGAYGADCSYGVEFLARSLAALSPALGRRWHFRAMDGTTHGIAWPRVQELFESADLFLNVSGGTLLRDAYMVCPCKVLIDSDPGWNHFVNYPRWDADPGWQGTHGWRAHDRFFTYAERIGREDCVLPSLGVDWKPTRPPVVLDRWCASPPGRTWTTVMTWDNFRRPIEHRGVVYGTKELEFGKIESLPREMPRARFELAVGGSQPPLERWRALGWGVIDSHSISATLDDYRGYVQGSRGEFSVVKNLYAATRSGWFSCRSVCYLAAGRPVVLQDTGFSEHLPIGRGLFAFHTLEQALEGLATVERDYARQQSFARELARTCFDSDRVLGRLLEEVELEPVRAAGRTGAEDA